MTVSSGLLDALDPEQREVAEALRGPVRVLAGAGTGKTRAITHRIAHGVASNVYAPHEVLAVTFTTRAAGEMRSRLRALGAGGVQARTFHSAALRQLRYFWPHVHGTELPQIIESKIGLLASAARNQRLARRPGAAPRPRVRDRVGQGQQRRGGAVRRRGGGPQPLGDRPDAGGRRPAVRRLRGGQARPGPDGHGGRPAAHRRAAGRGRAGRRAGPPAVQVVRRRRVPGRLAPPVGAARPVARRPRRAVRGRRPGADDLLLRRRQRRLPARLPGQAPRHHVDRAGPQLPLDPAGRRGRQPAARRHRRARAWRCGPSSRPVRRSSSTSAPTRWPRRRRSPPRSRRCGVPDGRRPRWRCCSGSTPSRRTSRRRWPAAASPTSSAGRRGSSTGPRCARR